MRPSGVGIIKISAHEINRETERRLIVDVVISVKLRRVVIDAVAAPQAGFTIAEKVVGEAEARVGSTNHGNESCQLIMIVAYRNTQGRGSQPFP